MQGEKVMLPLNRRSSRQALISPDFVFELLVFEGDPKVILLTRRSIYCFREDGERNVQLCRLSSRVRLWTGFEVHPIMTCINGVVVMRNGRWSREYTLGWDEIRERD